MSGTNIANNSDYLSLVNGKCVCACLGASALVVRGNRIYFMETRHRYMLRHQPTNCWLNLRKGKYTTRKLFHRSKVVD